MTPLEYIGAVLLAFGIGSGIGVVVWMLHQKLFS